MSLIHVILQLISWKDFLVNFQSKALSLGEKRQACEVYISSQSNAEFDK
jgi:hypothetical protein